MSRGVGEFSRLAVNTSRGVISLMFAVIVIPVVLLMLTITFELSQFFGIHDEFQKIVDREAHEVESRGLDQEEAQARIATAIGVRMADLAPVVGDAQVEVGTTELGLGRRSTAVRASAPFQGAFYRLAQRLFGTAETDLVVGAATRVSRQNARALIVLDRFAARSFGIVPPTIRQPRCTDRDYQLVHSFSFALGNDWRNAGLEVVMSISPGINPRVPVEFITPERLANLSCARTVRPSRFQFAAGVAQMVNAFIIGTEPEFVAHSVVLVLRRDEYLLGYATEAYSLLANLLSGTNLQLDLITVVLDTTRYDLRPTLAGINGGIHREVALTAQDFRGGGTGTLLRAVVAKTLNDRIVLER